MADFDGFYTGVLALTIALCALAVGLFRQRKRLTSNRWSVVVGWNVVLLLALVSLVFCGGETYYRFFVDTTDTFGLNKITRRWAGQYYQYNNLRARDNIDYQRALTPGKRRYTIFGDSFTAGHGIKNVDDRMGNRLRQQFPNAEVHVMAANGMESIDYAGLIPKLNSADGYQYDVVVLSYCLNDIGWLTPGMQQVYDQIYAFNDNLSWLERESYFINTLSFRIMAMNEPAFEGYFDSLKATYTGETWQQQAQTLAEMNAYLRQQNVQLVVVTWPFLQNLGPDYPFREVHRQLNDFWVQQNVPHLDLWPVLTPFAHQGLVVNPYDAHPNERANELATEAVAAFLKQHTR